MKSLNRICTHMVLIGLMSTTWANLAQGMKDPDESGSTSAGSSHVLAVTAPAMPAPEKEIVRGTLGKRWKPYSGAVGVSLDISVLTAAQQLSKIESSAAEGEVSAIKTLNEVYKSGKFNDLLIPKAVLSHKDRIDFLFKLAEEGDIEAIQVREHVLKNPDAKGDDVFSPPFQSRLDTLLELEKEGKIPFDKVDDFLFRPGMKKKTPWETCLNMLKTRAEAGKSKAREILIRIGAEPNVFLFAHKVSPFDGERCRKRIKELASVKKSRK